MTYKNTDRLWSLEAEAAVLGSMLIDSRCIGTVLPILDGGQPLPGQREPWNPFPLIGPLFLSSSPNLK